MSTPTYKSQLQLATGHRGGVFARLGSMFAGVGTPMYRGDGQPSPRSNGFFATATPIYKVTPMARPVEEVCGDVLAHAEQAAQTHEHPILIDSGALAAGSIAIVIPRELCAPRDACASSDGETVTQQ